MGGFSGRFGGWLGGRLGRLGWFGWLGCFGCRLGWSGCSVEKFCCWFGRFGQGLGWFGCGLLGALSGSTRGRSGSWSGGWGKSNSSVVLQGLSLQHLVLVEE